MEHYQLQLAVTAGELLLKSGGEISRVELTTELMAKKMGAHRVDCFVIPTGIIASIEIESDTYTFVRRIYDRGYNLKAVIEINELSRKFCSGELLLLDLAARLDEIAAPLQLTRSMEWKLAVATGFGALAFSFVLGLRSPYALFCATFNGFAVRRITDIITKRGKLPEAMVVFISSALLTLLTLCYPGLDTPEQNMVNLGGLFMLLPGVTLSTSFREMAGGDLLSGISRLTEAVFVLTMIAAGVISGYTLMQYLQEVMQLWQ